MRMVNSVNSYQLSVISVFGVMVLWCLAIVDFADGAELFVMLSAVVPFGVPQVLFDGDVDKGSGSDGDSGGGSDGGGDGGEQSAVSSQHSGARGDDGGGIADGADSADEGSDGGGSGGSKDFLDDLIKETNERFADEAITDSADDADGAEDSQRAEGDDESDGGEDSKSYREGFDPNDLVEVEGSEDKFFYHPEVHGKDTGQGSTYKKRDDAEYALAAKSSKLHELVSQLNENGKGIGAIEVPEWFGNPGEPDTILEAGDMEAAVNLPNEDLRGRVKEMDTLITKLSDRHRKVTSTQQNEEAIKEFENKKDEYATRLQGIMEELGIGDKEIVVDFQAENPVQRLEAELTDARDKKIADELKPLVEDYKKYKKNEDARINDDDYPEQLEKKYEAIQKKRTELTKQYNEKLNITNEIMELAKEVPDPEATQNETGETKAAKTKRVASVLKELGQEVDHPMFESGDPTGVKQFFKFAFDNAEKYNNLQTTFDANQALKAFDARMEELRRKARLEAVEGKNEAEKKKREGMPEYGNQKDLKPKGEPKDVREANRKLLDNLAEETNQAVS